MTTDNAKGFQDIIGEEALKRQKIREILVENFKKYGFEPVETPIIEYEEFVKQGNENDEAVSEVFKLQDRGNRKLALRYEFTFQLKRLSKNQKLPLKVYQIGPVFRDEPTSANRFRQFTQCDADILGAGIKDEAEILALAAEILNNLGIKFAININNRKLLNEILDKDGIKNKEQVIREIDKLDKLSEAEVKQNLRKYKAEKLIALFKKPESFFKKYKSYSEILELKKYCKMYGVNVKFQPNLARGLSYYNGNVFEIKSLIKESIGGGGSYLVNGIPATGISFGLERLTSLAKLKQDKEEKYLIISINQDKEAIKLAGKLRKKGRTCIIIDKVSKGLDYANSKKIPYVIFIGKDEVKKKKIKLRDMKTGKEKLISLSSV